MRHRSGVDDSFDAMGPDRRLESPKIEQLTLDEDMVGISAVPFSAVVVDDFLTALA